MKRKRLIREKENFRFNFSRNFFWLKNLETSIYGLADDDDDRLLLVHLGQKQEHGLQAGKRQGEMQSELNETPRKVCRSFNS